MKRVHSTFRTALLIVLFTTLASNMEAVDKKQLVLIETSLGNIKIRLYDETPQHRDNFIKLVQAHFYDSLLFHRVIKDFMIQGGDPESKLAGPDSLLGSGGPGYVIPAEIEPDLIHKRGVLSAARMGDDINPMKESSGSQFYIVWGKKYSQAELTDMVPYRINQAKRSYFNLLAFEKKDSIQAMSKANDKVGLDALQKVLADQTELAFFTTPDIGDFSDEQMTIYTTIGGTPSLDRDYTVFGEVVEGLSVVEKIQNRKTGKADRPLQDIRMKMRLVSK